MIMTRVRKSKWGWLPLLGAWMCSTFSGNWWATATEATGLHWQKMTVHWLFISNSAVQTTGNMLTERCYQLWPHNTNTPEGEWPHSLLRTLRHYIFTKQTKVFAATLMLWMSICPFNQNNPDRVVSRIDSCDFVDSKVGPWPWWLGWLQYALCLLSHSTANWEYGCFHTLSELVCLYYIGSWHQISREVFHNFSDVVTRNIEVKKRHSTHFILGLRIIKAQKCFHCGWDSLSSAI